MISRRTAYLFLLFTPAAYLLSQISNEKVKIFLCWAIVASLFCYCTTIFLIPKISHYLLQRGLKGKDYGRRGTHDEHTEIPSALGIVTGISFLICVILTQLYATKNDLEMLADYNAALLSITFMTLLGFADDVLDLPWRYKLILPTVASLPLLVTYHGGTDVLLPPFLARLLVTSDKQLTFVGELVDSKLGLVTIYLDAYGKILNLGWLYYVFMGLLAVFSTNAINIYAGINGLEAGQSLVISAAVLTANLHELYSGASPKAHFFSALLALPLIGAILGTLKYNLYPAKIFVGDTFCYFAGMTFAVQAILGHFSKSLLLFFIPQVINFVYSLPQLLKIYPCPRHRLPSVDKNTLKMTPSTFTYVTKDKDGNIVKKEMVNFTLINLVLQITGPMSEDDLTSLLLVLQTICCALGLVLRYKFGMALNNEIKNDPILPVIE